jgi:hypothetical protein
MPCGVPLFVDEQSPALRAPVEAVLRQVSSLHLQGFRPHENVKLNVVTLFLLFFYFFHTHAHSPNRATDFHGRELKTRVLT